MSRASASDLIQSLKRFIKSQGDTDPSVCQHFTLNPSSLHLLGRLLPNKGRDEEDLHFIAQYLQGLHYLQITSNRPNVVDDKGSFSLHFFPSLLFLEIERVKPHLILDYSTISDHLYSLKVSESLNSLEELLDNDLEQPPLWSNLRALDCSHNNIPCIDASMLKATQVRQLNLSHNLLRDISHLDQCFLLDELNLSYNHLMDLTDINAKLGNIRVLLLNNNQIKEIGSLEKLYSLERLDLSHNLISTANRVEGLGGLPNLQVLWLRDNPLTASESYRVDVYTAFGPRFEEVVLDGVPANPTEEESIRNTQALSAVVKTPPVSKHSKRKKIRKRVISTAAMKSTDGLEHYRSPPRASGEIQQASDFQLRVEELRESETVSWMSKFKGEVVKNAQSPPRADTLKKAKKKGPPKKKEPVWPSVLQYESMEPFTLELCVERMSEGGELEYQTLLLSEAGLCENELGTDENILTLERSQLLFAQDHGADEFGNPTLLLAYLPSPPDAWSAVLTQDQWHEQPHRTVVYHLHNQEEIDSLLQTFHSLCPRVVSRNLTPADPVSDAHDDELAEAPNNIDPPPAEPILTAAIEDSEQSSENAP